MAGIMDKGERLETALCVFGENLTTQLRMEEI